MSSKRTAILIVAIAVGIVAVLLIVKYVNGIDPAHKPLPPTGPRCVLVS